MKKLNYLLLIIFCFIFSPLLNGQPKLTDTSEQTFSYGTYVSYSIEDSIINNANVKFYVHIHLGPLAMYGDNANANIKCKKMIFKIENGSSIWSSTVYQRTKNFTDAHWTEGWDTTITNYAGPITQPVTFDFLFDLENTDDFHYMTTFNSLPLINDDNYEPNDDIFHGTIINLQTNLQNLICNDNVDYYKINISKLSKLNATIDFDHVNGELDFQLLNYTGNPIDESSITETSTGVSIDNSLYSGTYYLKVSPHTSGVKKWYNLKVDAEIYDVTPPILSVTLPSNGSIVSGVVPISGSATDESGINQILVAVNGQTIERFTISPFLCNWQTDNLPCGQYDIVVLAEDNAYHQITATTTVYKNDDELILGNVTPGEGTVDDNFQFQVTYLSCLNNAPDDGSVKVHFTNNNDPLVMNSESSDYKNGVLYTATTNLGVVQTWKYYFTAIVDGVQLRFPATDTYSVPVKQSVAGWNLIAYNVSAIMPKPGQTFNVACEVFNNSNTSDKIYYNVPWTLQLIDPSGSIVQSASGTIASINSGQTLTISKTFTAPSTEAVYQLIFNLDVDRDQNYSDNSYTRSLIVSASGPQLQWVVNSTDSWVLLTPSTDYPFGGYTWNYKGNLSTYAMFTKNSGSTPYKVYNNDFLTPDNGPIIIVYEENTGNFTGSFSFGMTSTTLVTFDQTNGTCLPGGTVTFVANTVSGTTFSVGNTPSIYRNGTVSSWKCDLNHVSSTQEKYTYTVPPSASPGVYDFFIGARLSGSYGSFIRELHITVLNPPPSISTISSSSISADDQITISGSNFGSSGTINFGSIVSSQIQSWTNTSIQCTVPSGISNSSIQVTNSYGVSNNFPYTVISSTGNPIVLQPIADASMWASDTAYITDLNNNFSDPNPSQTLIYSVSTTNSNVQYLSSDLANGLLKLYSIINADSTSIITITATDPLGKTVTNQFTLTLNKKLYPPEAPTLTLPINGAINQPYFPVLNWTKPTDATVNLLEISNDSNFNSIVFKDTSITIDSSTIYNLSPNTQYYWRVRCGNAVGLGPYSDVNNFFIKPVNPTILEPLVNSIGLKRPITFKWNKILNGLNYDFEISQFNDFSSIAYSNYGFSDTAYTVGYSDLLPNTKYYVRVRVNSASGNSDYSSILPFTAGGAVLSFSNRDLNIGTLNLNSIIDTSIIIYNTGVDTLIISDWISNPSFQVQIMKLNLNEGDSTKLNIHLVSQNYGINIYTIDVLSNTAIGHDTAYIYLNTLYPLTVTTSTITASDTTASSGGNIISDGGNFVAVRGICWSTANNPTIELTTKTTGGTGIGPL